MPSLSSEKGDYIKFLKFLLGAKKDKKNVHQLLEHISEEGVQKICQCFSNLIFHKELDVICYKKNKKNAEKLAKLINKHKKDIKVLTRHSTKKKDVELKRKIIQGKGIFTALALGIPSLIALLSK